MTEPSLSQMVEQVRAATAARAALVIRAGGTKDFYGNASDGERLDPRGYAGIVAHEPTELVITARCGTPLAELEVVLDAAGQMLAFEPPHFGSTATVGGCVAAGLSGPRRASAGGVRDFVLGCRLLVGSGEVLAFGGTVMKNVAGYDVARLAAGSLGVLGVITEVSLKVLPKPVAEATLRLELDEAAALKMMNQWAGQPLPVSATAWRDGVLHVRLSGARAAVAEAQQKIGGGEADGSALWQALREQTDAFFAGETPLWRLALPSVAQPLSLPGAQLIEWGGGQRWLRSSASASEIRARAAALGGHATLFRGGERRDVFTPLPPPLAAIHQRLKAEFDPGGIFNPGRMYEW
jgi:glycolate oxidase FAD binding subunit